MNPSKIEIKGDTLIAIGEIGYEQAGEFARLCDTFLAGHKSHPATIDLSKVEELVSPCLTAVYDDARLHRPGELKIIAPQRLAHLFEPGETEGLFSLEAL